MKEHFHVGNFLIRNLGLNRSKMVLPDGFYQLIHTPERVLLKIQLFVRQSWLVFF
ncbi:MAG: hypothetical protein UZ09_BCD002002037 [Bacteroidetes bacterium OLB9]|nr:MAG: hypothetical protein UZ09_BCD002002037 [Bacteroidetes bacterium OLB9]